MEKESLGLWVSEHPLQGVKDALKRKVDCPLVDVERRRDGEIVTVGGIVGALKALQTKKGDPMVFLRLDDLSGSLEAVVFNSCTRPRGSSSGPTACWSSRDGSITSRRGRRS